MLGCLTPYFSPQGQYNHSGKAASENCVAAPTIVSPPSGLHWFRNSGATSQGDAAQVILRDALPRAVAIYIARRAQRRE